MRSLLKTLRRGFYPTSVYAKTAQPTVFMEVAGETVHGKLKIRVFENLQPEASENFVKMCQGFKDASGKDAGYKGVKFVNVMRDHFMETESVDTTVFGHPILHENYDMKFSRPGLVGLSYDVDGGKEESNSGFFITLAELPFLSNHVVIGEVVEGLDVLQEADKRQELIQIKDTGFLGVHVPHDDHHYPLGDGRKPWSHPGDVYDLYSDVPYPSGGHDDHHH